MQSQEPIVDRNHISLSDPEWFFFFTLILHFESACRVLR